MQLQRKAYINMHIATFLWGITAILGKLISLNEFSLVWFRVLFVSVSMAMFPDMLTQLRQLDKRSILLLSGVGVILSLHWVTWYGAVKYANASVAVSCIAFVSLFVAVLEPIFNNSKFDLYNITLGVIVIPGILLINQSLDLHYKTGFLLGIIAAFLAAIFAILNKKHIKEIQPNLITFVQMLSGLIFLSLCLPIYIYFQPEVLKLPNLKDIILLIILSLGCTVIPYNLFLKTLKITDAFTTSLINNLEPVYGIILAALLLNEDKELNWKFYAGTLIILSAVFIHAYISSRQRQDN